MKNDKKRHFKDVERQLRGLDFDVLPRFGVAILNADYSGHYGRNRVFFFFSPGRRGHFTIEWKKGPWTYHQGLKTLDWCLSRVEAAVRRLKKIGYIEDIDE